MGVRMGKLGTTLQGPTGIALPGAVPALPGALVLGGILQGAAARGVMHDLVQPHYFASPEPIAIHIAAGIVFCVLAPLQFSARLRMRYRRLHRAAGRVSMIAGLLFGLSAIFLMGPPPVAPEAWLHYAGMSLAGFGVCVSMCMAFLTIRKGDVIGHRQWMRRVIAFGLFGASRVLFEATILPLAGSESAIGEGLSVWLALALNLSVAERLSRTDRRFA